MPWSNAVSTGLLKAVLSIRQHPMPFAFAATAVLNAETICETIELAEPVHWYEHPARAQASWIP